MTTQLFIVIATVVSSIFVGSYFYHYYTNNNYLWHKACSVNPSIAQQPNPKILVAIDTSGLMDRESFTKSVEMAQNLSCYTRVDVQLISTYYIEQYSNINLLTPINAKLRGGANIDRLLRKFESRQQYDCLLIISNRNLMLNIKMPPKNCSMVIIGSDTKKINEKRNQLAVT